jgi:hypothetical protein
VPVDWAERNFRAQFSGVVRKFNAQSPADLARTAPTFNPAFIVARRAVSVWRFTSGEHNTRDTVYTHKGLGVGP